MRDTLLWRKTLPLLLQAHAEVSDAELLRRFATQRDAAAFELLLHRHGPMVWATALRVVRHTATAADVFQATFWALAQHAGRLRSGTTLAGWLHRVAVRAGLDVLRRRKHTVTLPDVLVTSDPATHAQHAETQQQLDAAINRLPEKLRRAFILCVLDEHTAADAATLLGVPVGTVESRVSRAKQRLRVDCATLGSVLIAVPSVLLSNTLSAITAHTVTPLIHTLAKHAPPPPKFTGPLVALVMLTSVVALAFGMGQPEPPPPTPETPPTPIAKAEPPAQTPDVEPLPEGAIARFGSPRFRHGHWAEAIRCDPAGRTLAVAEASHVYFFDLATGQQQWSIPLPDKHCVNLLRFVKEGQQLALGTYAHKNARVQLIDVATGMSVATATFRSTNRCQIEDILPDGSRCLVVDWFRRTSLCEIATQREVWATDHSNPLVPRFIDGGQHWVGSQDTCTEVRTTATGQLVRTIVHPRPHMTRLGFGTTADGGQMVFKSSDNKSLTVLDATGKNAPRTLTLTSQLNNVQLSPSGRFVVATHAMGTHVWDLHRPNLTTPAATLPLANQADFTSDDSTLVLSRDGVLSLWDTKKWQPRLAADPPTLVECVRFNPEGTHIIARTQRGWQRWSNTGANAVTLSETGPAYSGTFTCASNGRVAADVVEITSSDTAKVQFAMRVTNFATQKSLAIPLQGWATRLPQLTADGHSVSAQQRENVLTIWDTTTGTPRTTVNVPEPRHLVGYQMATDGTRFTCLVTKVLNHSDEVALAAALRRGDKPMLKAVYVTNIATKQEWPLDPVPWWITHGAVRFSTDGTKLIVHGSIDELRSERLLVWDIATRRLMCNWKIGECWSDAYNFAPDTRSLVVGNRDGTLSIVEIATQQARAEFKHSGQIRSAAFHPSGWQVVAASPEAPVYVWDLLGKPAHWDAAKADAVWADFGADDAKKAFAVMRVLHTNPTEAIAFLRERVHVPTLDEAKWQTWLRQLDSDEFRIRANAQKELTTRADVLLPSLEAAKKTASDEKQQRLDVIIQSATTWTPDRFRYVRACEVLEGLRTPEAKTLLETWAKSASTRLSQEAKDSLRRLATK